MSTEPPQEQLDRAIRSYYEEQFDEDARIQTRSVGGQVELERTRRIIGPRLAPGSRVLDVGGATGVHSRWLAEAGHQVTLIDLVAIKMVALATRRAAEGGRHLTLRGCGPSVRRMLHLSRLRRMVEVERTA